MLNKLKNFLYRFSGRFSETRDGWYLCNYCAHMVWENFLYIHVGVCKNRPVIFLGPPKEK